MKYFGYIDGKFSFCTAIKAKNENKAEKIAGERLKEIGIKYQIGMVTTSSGYAEVEEVKDMLNFLNFTELDDYNYLVLLEGKFNYTGKVKAKNPEKAMDKLVKKLFKESEAAGLGIVTRHVDVAEIRRNYE